jgi:hypothetical protein
MDDDGKWPVPANPAGNAADIAARTAEAKKRRNRPAIAPGAPARADGKWPAQSPTTSLKDM